MSKYSTEQLKQMAKTCLDAKQTGDYRYMQLILTLSVYTNLSVEGVERNIYKLANGEKV